ncbi:MAG: hypothetical protein RIC14_00130 [Filomicrobium sp.]
MSDDLPVFVDVEIEHRIDGYYLVLAHSSDEIEDYEEGPYDTFEEAEQVGSEWLDQFEALAITRH